MKTLVRNRVDTYMYVQNTTVEALKLPYWRQITHNLEHFFLSGAPFMDPEFFSEDQQARSIVQGDRGGQKLGFVDLDKLVRMSAWYLQIDVEQMWQQCCA